jgi:hypothetical protein
MNTIDIDAATGRGTVVIDKGCEVSFRPGSGKVLANFDLNIQLESGRVTLTGNRILEGNNGSPFIAQTWQRKVNGEQVKGMTANSQPNNAKIAELAKKYQFSEEDEASLNEAARGIKRRVVNGRFRTSYLGGCGMAVGDALLDQILEAFELYLEALENSAVAEEEPLEEEAVI